MKNTPHVVLAGNCSNPEYQTLFLAQELFLVKKFYLCSPFWEHVKLKIQPAI